MALTLVFTIIGIISAALVTYAVFIMPYRTDWEAVARSLEFYDEPQSFTEVGLEAEWGTPRATPIEVPVLQNFSRPGHNNVQYSANVVPSHQTRRQRKSTVLGVMPASSNLPGIRRMSRNELAHIVRQNLCTPECGFFLKQDNVWYCQCGAVTKHANKNSCLSSQLSTGKNN